MLNTLKNKSVAVIDKVVNAKNAVVIASYTVATAAYAQAVGGGGAGGGVATQSAQKLGTTLAAFLAIMPIVARIAGLIVIIGGLWSLYKYYKSQGRDGSIAAGIAGIGVGVALFFLGGLLRFGADTVGIDQNAMPN